jgi:hypothetical protein
LLILLLFGWRRSGSATLPAKAADLSRRRWAQDRERVHHDPVALLPSAGNGRHATIELAASRLAAKGWTLRTDLSPGAEQAFYRGALAGRGDVELYLPGPAFQAHARLPAEGHKVLALAARFHPSWYQLSVQNARAQGPRCP